MFFVFFIIEDVNLAFLSSSKIDFSGQVNSPEKYKVHQRSNKERREKRCSWRGNEVKLKVVFAKLAVIQKKPIQKDLNESKSNGYCSVRQTTQNNIHIYKQLEQGQLFSFSPVVEVLFFSSFPISSVCAENIFASQKKCRYSQHFLCSIYSFEFRTSVFILQQ